MLSRLAGDSFLLVVDHEERLGLKRGFFGTYFDIATIIKNKTDGDGGR